MSCGKGLSTDDSAYASQEESSVASDSTHRLTWSCSCPQLAMKNIGNQLQRSMSLLVTTPSPPTPQAPASSTPSLASSQSPQRDIGQRCQDRPFQVILEQRVSGVGLLLGSVSGAVAIKYMVSFGSAAKEGTLR